MYAPNWSPPYWELIHAASRMYADGEAISQDELTHIQGFFHKLCTILPCPMCRIHCGSHMNLHPLNVTDGQSLFRYFVDFHNAVNTRTNRPQVSYEEALEYLNTTVAQYGLTAETLSEGFVEDWWFVLYMSSRFFTITPDDPKPRERELFAAFLQDACYVLPFGRHQLSDGKRTAREVMLAHCPRPEEITHSDDAFKAVLRMYNSVCTEFGVTPKSFANMTEVFNQTHQSNIRTVARHDQQRQEMGRKLQMLQSELNSWRDGRDPSNAEQHYRTATIVLGVLLGVALLVIMAGVLTVRVGPYKLVRRAKYKSPGTRVRS